MKKLLMAIFIPVLLILGTPALVATLMYDGTGDEHMPVDLYVEGADAMEMLFTELDNSISEVEAGTTEDLEFNLHEDIINTAIYEQFKEQNPDYAPGENCANDNECYVFAEKQEIEGYNLSMRLVGAWVSFYDGDTELDPGRLVFNAFLEISLDDNITYKTVLEVHFLFEDDPDYYYLEFDKIQLGRLPVPKALISSVINVADNQLNLNLEESIGDIPLGEFNLENISYTLPKDDILAQISESQEGNDAGADLAQELLSIVFDQQLILFDLEDEEFVLTAGVSQFRNTDDVDVPEYLYDLHDQEVVNGETVIGDYNPDLFNPEEHLKDLFTDFIFNNALVGGGFEIREKVVNKLIYSSQNGFDDLNTVQEVPISDTETKQIEFGLKGIWFEFEAEEIYVNALFRIGGIDSLLRIRAEEVSDETETDLLRFEFVEITAGKDEGETSTEYLEILDLDVFKQVFADLGDVEFAEFTAEGDLEISTAKLSALLQDGSNDGAVVVTTIDLEPNALVLGVEAADPQLQQALEDFQTALNDVIESGAVLDSIDDVIDPNDGGTGEAIYDSVENLQASLTSDETPDPADVETLVENLQELDAETQQDVLDAFIDNIDPTVASQYEDLFGEFSGTTEESSTTE